MTSNQRKRRSYLNESPVFTTNLYDRNRIQEVVDEYLKDCHYYSGKKGGRFRNSNLSNPECSIDEVNLIFRDNSFFFYYEAKYWGSDFTDTEIAEIANEFIRSFTELCREKNMYYPKRLYFSLAVGAGNCKVFELSLNPIPLQKAPEDWFTKDYCLTTGIEDEDNLPNFITSLNDIQSLKNGEPIPRLATTIDVFFKLTAVPAQHTFVFTFADNDDDVVHIYDDRNWEHARFGQMKENFVQEVLNYYRQQEHEIARWEYNDLSPNERGKPWVDNFIPDDNLTIDTLPEEAFEGEDIQEWDEQDWENFSNPEDSYFEWWMIGHVLIYEVDRD